ncbi:MAG: MTH938/NDUFAF3 family protein [Bacteroidales bacterium]
MQIQRFAFGTIQIDGVTYEYDVVIEGGQVRKRKKNASKKLKAHFGHTPLSVHEGIPWTCRRLIIGTGAHGALPVMNEVKEEAQRRGVELVILSTPDAIKILRGGVEGTNAILHVTC